MGDLEGVQNGGGAMLHRSLTGARVTLECSRKLLFARHLAVQTKVAQQITMAKTVGESHNFPREEESIIELWKKLDAFKTSLKLSEGKPRYSFYDGPPFATGLPHYGHILAGTIKDIVTRYAHQSGYHVERRFGWDCHGLPVEYEIDQKLGITGPDDVAKMGIDKYNDECRKIVMRYSKEWEFIVGRLGRWIDFENDYKTLYPWFMESVWWVFKEFHKKDMIYRGFRVMPYSTKCSTPLSNFEANQNYKEVSDPAVIVNFPLDESPDVSMIAWTTTPWTLPSNLALVVNHEHTYVKVKDNSNEKVYIMMEARLSALFKSEEEYTILDRFKGQTLKGKRYTPLFPYFEEVTVNYAFGGNPELASRYEPHSNSEVVVLLDVTPDQSMLDEGIAREVINRVQKLRKKAKVVPTEELTIVYEVLPGKDQDTFKKLAEVTKTYIDFITDGTKQAVVATPGPQDLDVIIEETVECKGANIKLKLLRGRSTSGGTSGPSPFCKFLNLEYILQDGSRRKGTLLLENPVGEYIQSKEQLRRQAEIIFGLQGRHPIVSPSPNFDKELSESVTSHHGQTLYVRPKSYISK